MDDNILDTGSRAPGAAPEEIWQRVSQSVFRLDQDAGHGTAWLAALDTWVTDAHCLKNTTCVTLIGQDNKRYQIGEVWLDPQHDLAVLKAAPGTASPTVPALALRGSSRELQPNEKTYSFGYKGDLSSILGLGVYPGTYIQHTRLFDLAMQEAKYSGDKAQSDHLAAVEKKTDALTNPETAPMFRPLVQLKNETGPGTSGGPDVDAQGRVVAVICKGSRAEPGTEFSTPIDDVRALLANKDTGNFKHYVATRQTGLESTIKTMEHHSLIVGLQSTVVAGTMWLGHTYIGDVGAAGSFARTARVSKAIGALGSALVGYQTYRDASALLNSTDTMSRWKYGLATVGDTTALAGMAGSLFARSIPRYTPTGRTLFAVGLLTRFAAEYIPNEYGFDFPATKTF